VAGPHAIIDYLRANMRSQMYAKSLPMPLVIGNIKRMEIIDSPEGDALRAKCWQITHAIQDGFRKEGFDIGEAQACVTPVHIFGGVGQATKMAKDLRENYRIFCSMVIYPVIPKGMIIFRIVCTAAHTMEDVAYTLNAFKEIKAKLDAGAYDGDDIAATWTVDPTGGVYHSEDMGVFDWTADTAEAEFTVPADAQSGDSFLLTLRARDAADAPMTRYAQVQIIVK
jgi:glycine C-acetyltransferase